MTETTTVETLSFDANLITPRMLVDFKRETGASLMAILDEGFDLSGLPEEVVAGVIWIALRMSGQPDATFDDALDTPITALAFEEADEVDPTSAGTES